MVNRKDAKKIVEDFFSREEFSPEEVRKIKRLAMKFRVRLGEKRRKFCSRCLNPLRGKTSFSRLQKRVVCEKCGWHNRLRLTKEAC